MSSSSVIPPNTSDTTFLADSVAVATIVPADIRQVNDSLASLPFSSQSGTTYTFAAADFGTVVRFTSSSAVTVTIPSGVFTAGNVVYGRAEGTGALTIVAGSGMTLNVPSTLALTPVQWATWAIHFTSTSVSVLM
jgi:hypothetical protein